MRLLLASRYVPDTSKVRQKMLYASSKKDLLLKLGSSLFADDDFYVGEASDLTFDGLVHSTRKATHAERAEMLTEAEAAHVVSISETAHTPWTVMRACFVSHRFVTAGSFFCSFHFRRRQKKSWFRAVAAEVAPCHSNLTKKPLQL